MTALIPAMAKRRGIKSLFTVHNIHTREVPLPRIEESGIDAAEFWMNMYFCGLPQNYDHARSQIPVDLLASGIFAAHYINTVSPRFLWEIVEGWHSVVPDSVRDELRNKFHAGCSAGILNAPDPTSHPATDDALVVRFTSEDPMVGKAANKVALQQELKLKVDPDAPMFFWPSRLDPFQKGPQLLTEILHQVVSAYWDRYLQIVVVANGPHQPWIRKIITDFDLQERVAAVDFDERLSRLAYAASDFMLMPSLFEPCGLPQMTAPIYGSLPVVHSTGGLYDTVRVLDVAKSTGNGFRFDKEASSVKIKSDRGGKMVRFRILCIALNPVMHLAHPSIQTLHGSQGRCFIDLYLQVLQPAKPRHNVQRKVFVIRTARKPRPHAVLTLHFRQLLHGLGKLKCQSVFFKEKPHIASGFRFLLSIVQPRCLFDHDRFEVLVFRKRRFQRLRLNLTPCVEDSTHLGIVERDMLSQGVGIQSIEGLLAALIRILHQVR
jgi:hypothetical protein